MMIITDDPRRNWNTLVWTSRKKMELFNIREIREIHTSLVIPSSASVIKSFRNFDSLSAIPIYRFQLSVYQQDHRDETNMKFRIAWCEQGFLISYNTTKFEAIWLNNRIILINGNDRLEASRQSWKITLHSKTGFLPWNKWITSLNSSFYYKIL